MNTAIKSVDDYIANYPEEVQGILNQIRTIIKNTVPEAVESISYGMPGYKTHGKPLVYFAAFKNHIGFYATPAGQIAFAAELSGYKQGKGSVQFPLHQPIPFDLIKKMVAFKAQENSTK